MRKAIALISFSFIFLKLSSQASYSEEVFQVIQTKFSINVSSEGLTFKTNIRRPETIPQTLDTETWRLISETSVYKNLGGKGGQLKTVKYSISTGELDYQIWTSAGTDLVAFRQTFTNKTKKTVRLNNLYPLFIEGSEGLKFGSVHDWRIFEQFRHKNDLPKTEIPAALKSISCDPFFIINNEKMTGKNLFIGYQTFDLHLAQIDISFDKDLCLENITAKCEFDGVEIPPDGTRTSQWVNIARGEDANLLIEDYTGRIRDYYNMEAPPANAPTVYCTWYYHADSYNEEIFKGDILQFKKEHLPFDVFLIDECWDVNDWGDFEANESFPDGMKWAAGEINSAGYIAGIWTAPFLVDGESSLAKNHPSWLLRNSKGVLCTFNMNGRDHFIFDLTYPGVCEYIEEQFRKISRDWGYSYFKFDFMRSVFIDSDQQFFDKTSTSLEAYRKGLEAIRRGVGKEAYISVCGGHYGASYGIANTQRSGSDVKSQWNENELPKYRQNILRTWMSGLWHVDPDAMMVRNQPAALRSDNRNLTLGVFTREEAFTNTLNQFFGGNLITFTEDFARIDNERKMLYRHVIPSVNSSSIPVDLFNTTCPETLVTKIKPVCLKLGEWNMLSMVNWSNESKEYQVTIDNAITWNLKGDRFLIYDFQGGEILAYLEKGSILKVENLNGHQSKLLKIVPWDGSSAMFVGTDLNFSCGGLEISDILYNNGSISGAIETGWNIPVTLTFVLPATGGYEMKKIQMSPGQKSFILNYQTFK